MKKFLVFLLLTVLIPLSGITAENKTITLHTYDTVVYRGEVTTESVTAISIDLLEKHVLRGTKDYPIYLVIDSPGGTIYIGEQFIQLAKVIPNVKTVTIFAASMASAIVEGLPGERLIVENGILMFHRARGQFQGQFEEGELESELALWKKFVQNMEQRSANRMSMSLEDYKKKVKDEYWIQGADAVSSHGADSVVDIVCTKNLINARQTITQDTLFGTQTLNFSGCPLFRAPL